MIKIDEELRSLIPPLTLDEFKQLEANIIEWGCRDKLTVWAEHGTLLDGHNRYEICTRNNIEYEVEEIELESKEEVIDWIIKNQLGRRNLTSEQISYLRGKQYHQEKKKITSPNGRKGNSTTNLIGAHFEHQLNEEDKKTCEKLAEQHKVGQATVRRDAEYAKAVDKVAEVAGNEARVEILSRDTKVTKQDAVKLGAIAEDSPQAAKNVLEQVKQAPSPKAAKKVINEAHQQVQAHKELAKSEDQAEAGILPGSTKPKPSDLEQKDTKATGDLPKDSGKVAQQQTPLSQVAVDSPPLTQNTDKQDEKRPELVLSAPAQEKDRNEEIITEDGIKLYILHRPNSKPVFNKTNEAVDWAQWTWNPVTGCLHGCNYCYAREIANAKKSAEAFPYKFEPTFHPARLAAPKNTSFPKNVEDPRAKNVFVCSMADLFGKWVPDEWIMRVFDVVLASPEWNFLFLTKFPQRLQEVCDRLGGSFPDNAWVGTTVDTQARVRVAEKAFRDIKAKVKWLSCEPLLERLNFHDLDMFDWVVIGGQSASHYNNTPAFQPDWKWVESLWMQAREAGCSIYWKENLTVRPKETPW